MIIFAGYIQTNEQISIIAALSDELLEEELNAKIQSAIKRVKSLSEKRNKIVHGQWGSLDGEEARFWRGLTLKHISEIASGRKPSRTRENVFTLTDIASLIEQAISIRNELVEVNNLLIEERLKRNFEGKFPFQPVRKPKKERTK